MNRKGFTLVELLAVLVLLSVIMAIVIPSLSASMSRTKNKQNESNYKFLESAASMYVSDYLDSIKSNMGERDECYIAISDLLEDGYVDEQVISDQDGNEYNGVIVYNKKDNSYLYKENISGINSCM